MMLRLSPSVTATKPSASSMPGPAQDVGVGAVADHLVALEVVGQHAARGGARELVGVPVDDHDLVAGLVHVGGDLRTDPTAADDQQLQGWLIIGRPFRMGGLPGRRLLGFGRLRFPFTFMGLMALGIGALGRWSTWPATEASILPSQAIAAVDRR